MALDNIRIASERASACNTYNHLRWLLLDDEWALDELVEQHVEAVGELGEDVHAALLVGDVEPLLDHLQLPDLLPIDPDYFRQVLAPSDKTRSLIDGNTFDQMSSKSSLLWRATAAAPVELQTNLRGDWSFTITVESALQAQFHVYLPKVNTRLA